MSQMRPEWKPHGQKTSLTCFVVSGDSGSTCLLLERETVPHWSGGRDRTSPQRLIEKLSLTVQGQFSQKTEGQDGDQTEIKAGCPIQKKCL